MADPNLITVNRVLYARIFSKIQISTNLFRDDPCWDWHGSYNPKTGYGSYGIGGIGSFLAHRLFYTLFVEPIPAGLCIDHLCRNRRCVNPAHLEVVTHKENTARAHMKPPPVPPIKSVCCNGHGMEGDNVRWGRIRANSTRLRRYCRLCHRDRERRRRQRLRQVA